MAGMMDSLAYMASYKRRVKRKEFFFSYVVILIFIVVSWITCARGFDENSANSDLMGTIGVLLVLFGYWMLFANYVSRIRDIGKSPWLALLFFVPLINFFFLLYLFFAPSAPGR